MRSGAEWGSGALNIIHSSSRQAGPIVLVKLGLAGFDFLDLMLLSTID